MRVAANMAVSVTEVRGNFRQFIDDVIRRGPKPLKRHRDVVFAISAEHLQSVLDSVKLTMEYARESDGSYSGHLQQLDLVANAPTVESLKRTVADDLLAYAEDYLRDFDVYYHAPNRRHHLPIVLKVMATENEAMPELIDAKME